MGKVMTKLDMSNNDVKEDQLNKPTLSHSHTAQRLTFRGLHVQGETIKHCPWGAKCSPKDAYN